MLDKFREQENIRHILFEFGDKHDIQIFWVEDPITLEVTVTCQRTNPYAKLEYSLLETSPTKIMKDVTEKWLEPTDESKKDDKQKFRDKLVQMIKDSGQELIDRAEDMVGEDLDLITDFDIHIKLEQPLCDVPEITWTTSVVNKNVVKNLEKGE